MSKIAILPFLFVLSICGCCSGVLVMFAPDAPARDFSVNDLVIEKSWFPSGWINDWTLINSQCFGGDPIGQEAYARYSFSGENDPNMMLAHESIC